MTQKLVNIAETVQKLRKLDSEQNKAFVDLINFFLELDELKDQTFSAIYQNTENTLGHTGVFFQELAKLIPAEYLTSIPD